MTGGDSQEDYMFRRMLVAYDGSESAEAALRLATDLARHTGAELATVSVEAPLPRYAETISTSSRSTHGTRHSWMAWTWRPSSGRATRFR
jgi:nucleotide-binding universal stress UspA family protein